MTMPIMDTDTATTAAAHHVLRPIRASALVAGWWSDAAGACMAACIIGTGHPVVQRSGLPRYAVGGNMTERIAEAALPRPIERPANPAPGLR